MNDPSNALSLIRGLVRSVMFPNLAILYPTRNITSQSPFDILNAPVGTLVIRIVRTLAQ